MKKFVGWQIAIMFVVVVVYFFALHFGANKEDILITAFAATAFAATAFADKLKIKYQWVMVALLIGGIVVYAALLGWIPVVILGVVALLFLRDVDATKKTS